MFRPLALVACCAALVGTPYALAQTQGDPSTDVPQATVSTQCQPMKKLLSWKNWRDAHPLRGTEPCPNSNKRKLMSYFRLYRHYREIAPYRCLHGREGYFAIPCYIISCESGFNWWAMNSSGASYIYQLLGWGAPAPRTFRDRVRNHEIATSLSLSNWECA